MKSLFSLKPRGLLKLLILFPLFMLSKHLSAEETSATLDHIKSSSSLNIGYRQLEPFSFRDKDGKVTGYTISLCNIVADELRVVLGIKKLTINYIPILFTERIPALNSHKIDLDCSVNTVAPERTNSVSFSIDYFVSYMRIISLRKNNIKNLNDLKGRTISVPRGSKDLLEVNRINREKNLNLSIVTSDTVGNVFDLMAQNHTAALLLDDILVYPYINQTKHPEDFTISHETVGEKMKYALMMRKEDPLFVAFVNKTLEHVFESPLHDQLAKKWLIQDVVIKNTQKN